VRLALASFAFVAVLATWIAAEDVYRWTDADGRIHFSSSPPADGSTPKKLALPDGSSEGWEGDLDRERKREAFEGAADSSINALQTEITRRRRARDVLRSELEGARRELGAVDTSRASEASALRARVESLVVDFERAERDLANAEAELRRLRRLKAVGEAKLAEPPPLAQ
jgi:hypothetical protein